MAESYGARRLLSSSTQSLYCLLYLCVRMCVYMCVCVCVCMYVYVLLCHIRMWCAMAESYEKLERVEDAIKCYLRAEGNQDREGIALTRLARLYQKLGGTENLDRVSLSLRLIRLIRF